MAIELIQTMINTHQQADRRTSSAFRLGGVEVRPESLVLVVDGERRHVEPRVMDLLVYGSDRAGQLLTKQQIMQDVWGGTHFVPEALQRAVSQIRKSLDDDLNELVFIETISRKGYRFLITPEPLPDPGAEAIKLTEKSIRSSPLFLIIAALALMLLTWLAILQFEQEDVWAPEADGKSNGQGAETAPVPKPDD